MTTQMEKLSLDAQYNDVVAAAKSLGIDYVGKKKPVLIGMINDKLDAIANGEVEIKVETPETPVDEANETETPSVPATPAATTTPKASRQPATPRAKGAKWYETTTPIYNEGDIVDIIGGPCLIGRQAQITRPSAKKDAMKCKLINPKDGTLQGTEITMDYWKLKLAKKAGETETTDVVTEINDEPQLVEEKEPVVEMEGNSEEEATEATA